MILDEARQLRKLLENNTENMDDEKILSYPAFVEKWHPGTSYAAGKRVAHDNVIYKVLQDHTSQDGWEPDNAQSLFARVLIPDTDTIYDWVQPDSTNPYMQNDRVRHNGVIWVSDADNNVWEPGAAGTESLWHMEAGE